MLKEVLETACKPGLLARHVQVIPVFLTFSARTSANQTQDLIDGKMEKRRKVGSWGGRLPVALCVCASVCFCVCVAVCCM